MVRIAVCICTYNRPEGLEALLATLEHQRMAGLADGDVAVFVIDNSANGSAKETCDRHALQSRFATTWVPEPRKGLAFARNAALAAAREARAPCLAFIDDDELADPGWLESLHRTFAETGAAAAIGPVFPLFETPPGPWTPVEAYVTARRAPGGFASDGYTGNTMLDMAKVTALSLSFDARFNDLGGEDTILFRRLLESGERIATADLAIAYERVPKHRMTARWLWRRWFRTGIVEAHLGHEDPASLGGRAMSLAKGIVRMAAGALRIVLALLMYGWRRPARVTASFYTACRGAGLLASALGLDFKEYRHKSYR